MDVNLQLKNWIFNHACRDQKNRSQDQIVHAIYFHNYHVVCLLSQLVSLWGTIITYIFKGNIENSFYRARYHGFKSLASYFSTRKVLALTTTNTRKLFAKKVTHSTRVPPIRNPTLIRETNQEMNRARVRINHKAIHVALLPIQSAREII